MTLPLSADFSVRASADANRGMPAGTGTRGTAASAISAFLAGLALVVALGIWFASLRPVDPSEMTDLGLASVMSRDAWVPFILLSAGFFFLLGVRDLLKSLALLYIAALIVILHVTPILEYGTIRYPWVWKHLGLIDYIERVGALDPTSPLLAAYHNWPGLFAGVAMVAELIGVRDLATPLMWWPPVVTLLGAVAFASIARQLTADPRVVYAGVWVFVAGNWIGQDYFSPQSAAYLFYLALLAMYLAFIVRPSPVATGGTPASATVPGERILPRGLARYILDGFPDGKALRARPSPGGRPMIVASGVAFFLMVAIVATHQFSPLVVVLLLAGFVAVRLSSPGLFLFAGLAFVIWTTYAASPYLATYLASEVEGVGSVGHFTSNLVDTGVVSSGQAIVSWSSRAVTVAVGLAAVIGFLRRFAAGYRDIIPAIIVAAPIPIGLGTAYGGEVIFRVYLFALPGLAFFAAAAFFPTPAKGRSLAVRGLAAIFALALAVGFVFANNGKDRQYVASRDEIATLEWLYDTAPPGSLLVEGATVYPRQMRNYENFLYVSIVNEPDVSRAEILEDPANTLARWLDDEHFSAGYIVLTRSQKAYVDAVRELPAGSLDVIEQELLASPRFKVVRQSADVTIFSLNPTINAMGAWVQP